MAGKGFPDHLGLRGTQEKLGLWCGASQCPRPPLSLLPLTPGWPRCWLAQGCTQWQEPSTGVLLAYLCHRAGGWGVGVGSLSPPRGPLWWLHGTTDPHRRNFFAQPHSSGHSILSLAVSFSPLFSLHSSPSCQWGLGAFETAWILGRGSCSKSIWCTHRTTLPALPVSRAPEPRQSFYRKKTLR